ncbi:unnamed protein product [Allacma fusca]|uniref:General transcription factor TFIIB n=1 Tax=Allacma fusca TaxID=39272 RepID=A0A8J2KRH2_9HEXA|nr:unnamed protein product [Allacma fusca]
MLTGNLDLGCRFHPGGQLIENFQSGDRICRECGLIIGGRAIDVGSELRTVSTGRVPRDASRLDEAENPRSSASVDRILADAFNRVSPIADRDLHGKQMLKYRSKDAIATASLYVACRQENIPRTFKEMCEGAQKSKKEIGRCYKLILRVLNIWVTPITAVDFMPGLCTKLKIPSEIQNAATEIASNAVDKDLVPGLCPITVTAAAIYIASQASSIKRTQKEIAKKAGIVVPTLDRAYKLMNPSAEGIVSPEF